MILSWETGWWAMARDNSAEKKESREHGRRQSGGPMGHLRRPKERAKDVQGTLVRIWGYVKRQKGALTITALLVVASSGLGILGPYLMGRTIDGYIHTGDLGGLAGMAFRLCE
jgi:ATP-binding cassette subfamily B protein